MIFCLKLITLSWRLSRVALLSCGPDSHNEAINPGHMPLLAARVGEVRLASLLSQPRQLGQLQLQVLDALAEGTVLRLPLPQRPAKAGLLLFATSSASAPAAFLRVQRATILPGEAGCAARGASQRTSLA